VRTIDKPIDKDSRQRHTFKLSTLEKFGVIDKWLNYVGVSFTVLLMLMTVINVAGRYLLNSPVRAYVDSMEMMMALLVFLCLAYCQWKGGHIRFELFMTQVLKSGRRYYLVESVNSLLAASGFALIAIYSLKTAIHAYVIHDVTIGVYLPIWPAKMGVALGSIFLFVRFTMQILSSLTKAVVSGAENESTEERA
jgi:TRAP-type C4-dicarboxylate transport system permease small subunit